MEVNISKKQCYYCNDAFYPMCECLFLLYWRRTTVAMCKTLVAMCLDITYIEKHVINLHFISGNCKQIVKKRVICFSDASLKAHAFFG